jgi:PAS domain S-box-containing protein
MCRFWKSVVVKIGIIVLGLEILLLAVTGLYYTQRLREVWEQEQLARLRVPAILLAQGHVPPAVAIDPARMTHLLGFPVRESMLIDADGTIRAALQPEHIGRRLSDIVAEVSPTWFSPQIPRQPHTSRIADPDSRQQMLRLTPLPATDIGPEVGSWLYLKAVLPHPPPLTGILSSLCWACALGNIFVVGVGLFFSSYHIILTRLDQAVTIVRCVKGGNLAARIPEPIAEDEIGCVQHEINAMAEELQETIAALKHEILSEQQAEQALSDEHNLLRTLIDSLPEVVYVKDCQHRFLLANQAAAHVMGVSAPAPLLGRSDQDFYPPDVARQFQAEEQAIITSGRPTINREEVITDHKTGQLRWLLTTKIPLRDRQGRLTGLININRDITEQKQAEEALRESKNLLHSLVEALPQNIFSKDLQGRFTFANQRFCLTEGKTLEEIIGKTDYDLHSPEFANKYKTDDQWVIETKQTFDTIEEHQTARGRKFYVQVIKTPMYDFNNKVIGILGIFWDITERKKADEAFRESQKRYRNLIENAPLGILSIDLHGNIMDVNSMLVAMLGSPSPEATRELNVLTSSSFIEAGIADDFKHCMETGLPLIAEHQYTTNWDKQVYLRYHLTPIRDEEQTITGVQAIVEDSTERMLVERALKESEAEYRSLFKNMHSGLAYHKILLDAHNHPIDYVFLDVNEAFENLTGLKDVVGKRATEVMPEITTLEPNLIEVYGQVALTGQEISFDLYFEPFGLWLSTSAYSPEHGYFVTVQDDITEQKWAEESLRKLNEDLEQRVQARTVELQRTNQFLQESLDTLEKTQKQLVESEKMAALGGLVAGVAHEINTPLGVGVTAASHLVEKTHDIEALYREGGMKRSDLEKYLSTAQESTGMILENLKRAAENIKSFKQVAVDQTHDTKRQFKLKQCVDDVLLSLHPKLKRTQYTVKVDCPDDLEIASYPGAYAQILTNLIMNSLIHGFEDQPTGTISLRIREEGETLWLDYRDDGKGMTEAERAHVFEPFYTTKRGKGGTGLGLHIVYNMVTQQLNGHIECRSAPNQGAEFILRLPKVPEQTLS